MTSITLSFFGPPEQKHVCKVTAMQTLTDALQSVSSKFKPPLQPDQCELHVNKKPVDMRMPFRLLNVPAGSKLEIIKKAASEAPATRASTPSSSTAAQVTSLAPAAAAPAPAVPPAPAAAATAAAATAAAAAAVQGTVTQPEQAPKQQQVTFSTDRPATVTATGGAQHCAGPSAAAGSSSAPNPVLAALGVTVPVYVFHHRAIEAAAEQAARLMDVDPPDEFFELTADDLQRLQHQANEKRKAESVFRSRAAREAEEAARAASMGPVHVRLHFPDGTILQAAFKATDPLTQVQELLRKCAAPDLAGALYLYTTPPKTVLKDSAATLYHLQLVPAAHIFVGVDEKKLQGTTDTSTSGPFLRTEVQSLLQDTVPDTQPATQQHQQQDHADTSGSSSGNSAEAMAAVQRAMRLAAAASRQAGAASTAAAGAAKAPKWFKK